MRAPQQGDLECAPWTHSSNGPSLPSNGTSGFAASSDSSDRSCSEATAGVTHPRLLDAGCGTGTNLMLLQRYGTPYGLELQWRGLRFARDRGLPRLTQGSVTALPYASSSMDVVASFDVLYCLPDASETAAISEMNRVLKPGGALILNVAAMKMLTGDHSVLWRRGSSLFAPRAASKTRSAPGFVWRESPTQTHSCSP